MINLLPDLPDDSALWIYAASRPLTADEQEAIDACVRPFIDGWTSHGRPVRGGFSIVEGRFGLVSGLVERGDLSGCGIDASVHALELAADRIGFEWLPALAVVVRDHSGRIRHTTRRALRQTPPGETPQAVFDLSLTTLGDLRAGRFEQSPGESWAARLLPASAARQ